MCFREKIESTSASAIKLEKPVKKYIKTRQNLHNLFEYPDLFFRELPHVTKFAAN